MTQGDDLAQSWLAMLRRNRIVAAVIVFSVIVIGAASLLGGIRQIAGWLCDLTRKPSVFALSLSPEARGYKEVRAHLFESSTQTYRTFETVYAAKGAAAVLLVTISNPTNEDVTITEMIYDVEQIGSVRASASGPLEAQKTYLHTIEHRTESSADPSTFPSTFRLTRRRPSIFSLQPAHPATAWAG